jgi:hypothetical protein
LRFFLYTLYNKKSKGPRLDPWGTPHTMPFCSDLAVWIVHICCLSLRYDLKRSRGFPLIPYCSSFNKRILWFHNFQPLEIYTKCMILINLSIVDSDVDIRDCF